MPKHSIPVDAKNDADYQAEEDARTLERMGEIMGDPKRHARAKKQMEKKMADTKRSHSVVKKVMGMGLQKEDSMGAMITKRQKGEAA